MQAGNFQSPGTSGAVQIWKDPSTRPQSSWDTALAQEGTYIETTPQRP